MKKKRTREKKRKIIGFNHTQPSPNFNDAYASLVRHDHHQPRPVDIMDRAGVVRHHGPPPVALALAAVDGVVYLSRTCDVSAWSVGEQSVEYVGATEVIDESASTLYNAIVYTPAITFGEQGICRRRDVACCDCVGHGGLDGNGARTMA
ncbi:hypothetical protein CTA1_1009 [Colletotrichum tanaceti]|uniref:Uncharacterized protein n=1 Tax=Colletotrichum tanaceti TaxID=1306861 RepID=A0A4U6XDA1_9PEZI|nr:hypothetical protein CTA1_1009 [Colletotrichum tanaceti]